MTNNKTLNNIFVVELDEFPNYFISENGDVYSDKRGKMEKMNPANHCGYLRLTVRKNNKKYYKFVHRLLAETFIANPNNLEQVDHINHNPVDNRLENMRWVTERDNQRNRSIAKNNLSGYQGVCFQKRGNSWKAQWRDNNKKKCCKSFSVKKYGEEEAKQMAIDIRQKMVDKYYNRVN